MRGRGCGCGGVRLLCSRCHAGHTHTRTHTGCHHGTFPSPLRLSVPLLGPAVRTHTTSWVALHSWVVFCYSFILSWPRRERGEPSRAEPGRAEGRRTRGHFGSLHRSGAPRTRGGERRRGGGGASRSLRSILSSSSPGSNFSLCPRGERGISQARRSFVRRLDLSGGLIW